MAVRRMRRPKTRRLVLFAKPRVNAVNTKKGWDDLLRKAGRRVVVVMFGGEKSIMCHRFEPVFAELSKRKEFSQIVFVKIDVEKIKGVSEARAVKQLPTFMCFRSGRVIEKCEATTPTAVRQMLERVSQSTGIFKLVSGLGRLLWRGASLPLRPVGWALRPRAWKLVLTLPLLALAYQRVLEQRAHVVSKRRVAAQKRNEEFVGLVSAVGWQRAKQIQRYRWLVHTVRQLKQFEAGVAVKDIQVDMSDVDLMHSREVSASSASSSARSLGDAGRAAAGASPQVAPASRDWADRASTSSPSRVAAAIVRENEERERRVRWMHEVKLKYREFSADTIRRWRNDVSESLCLKPGSDTPAIDWPRLEFGESTVSEVKKQLLLRTGFDYDTERVNKEAYDRQWAEHLASLREEVRRKLVRLRKPSPLTIHDYSRQGLSQGARSRVFLGDPAPRPYFWK